MFDSSNYYRFRNNPSAKISTHHHAANASKQQKCNLTQLSEYNRAVQAHVKQTKQMEEVDSNFDDTISKLKSEKRLLQKSLETVLIEKQMVNWERIGLQNILKQQQQQIIIYRTQQQEKEEGLSLLRRQNLMQAKERDQCILQKDKAQSTQLALSQQIKALQRQVTVAMKVIQVKTETNRQISQKLQEVEQQNMHCIQNINILDDMIEANTLAMQRKLMMQSELANKYADLKRNKKQILSKITEIKQDIQQESTITAQSQQVQQGLNQSLSQIQTNIQVENNEITKLKCSNLSQKKEAATNKQCLIKLRLYLQSLKDQNSNIELYIEHIFEQDQQIKSAIDRKHCRSSWREGGKSMGSTFG